MELKKKCSIVRATLLALACVGSSANAALAGDRASIGDRSNLLFMGGDLTAQYGYPYVGFVHHFNGSIFGDGFLIRAFGSYTPYSYTTNAVPGGKVSGDAAGFDVMVGYQKVLQEITLRGFLGYEFENDDLSPDNPFDKNRGADSGVKVQGELETNYDTPYYANLIGSFGTAKDRYWTRLRVGYDFGWVILGPEALLLGSQEFDEQRGGIFVTVKNIGPMWVSVASGFSSKPANRSGDSAYGTLEVSFTF